MWCFFQNWPCQFLQKLFLLFFFKLCSRYLPKCGFTKGSILFVWLFLNFNKNCLWKYFFFTFYLSTKVPALVKIQRTLLNPEKNPHEYMYNTKLFICIHDKHIKSEGSPTLQLYGGTLFFCSTTVSEYLCVFRNPYFASKTNFINLSIIKKKFKSKTWFKNKPHKYFKFHTFLFIIVIDII